MIQIKKTILTLVALLAVTTGAWAESKPIGLNVEYAAGDEITSTTDVYVYYGEQSGTLRKMGVKITSTQPLKIFEITAHGFEVDGGPEVYFLDNGESTNGSAGGISCFGESTGDATVVHVASGSGTLADPYVFGSGPSGTPVPLTWDATAKTATLTNGMPAGNVTVRVKYFAQAEFAMSTGETPLALAPTAIDGVPANTDDPIVTPGTVANIGTSEVKQGTLMYFVKQADGNIAPTAPTYTTEGWSENVPTANGLQEGDAYVWYYIKGAEPAQGTGRTDDNTCSDSDIKPLGTNGVVTLLPEPTYTVTLNDEGLSTDEAAAWQVAKGTDDPAAFPLEGVVKGTEVTVTYTGTKKIIGVKAEKAPIYTMAKDAASDDIGKLICTDGHIHAYGEDAECTADRVAMIAYVGNASDCSHGLAIALQDESGQMNWETAGTTCSGKTPTVTDGTWRLPSIMDWQYMLIGCGHNGTANANIPTDYYMVATGLFAKLSAAGGDEFIYWIAGVQDANYWMSTENSGNTNQAWRMHFNSKDEAGFHNTTGKNENTINVRACLAF